MVYDNFTNIKNAIKRQYLLINGKVEYPNNFVYPDTNDKLALIVILRREKYYHVTNNLFFFFLTLFMQG